MYLHLLRGSGKAWTLMCFHRLPEDTSRSFILYFRSTRRRLIILSWRGVIGGPTVSGTKLITTLFCVEDCFHTPLQTDKMRRYPSFMHAAITKPRSRQASIAEHPGRMLRAGVSAARASGHPSATRGTPARVRTARAGGDDGRPAVTAPRTPAFHGSSSQSAGTAANAERAGRTRGTC